MIFYKWKKCGLFLGAFFFLTSLFCASAFASVEIAGLNFGETKWVKDNAPLRINFSRLLSPEEGRWGFFIGQLDITSQVEITGKEATYHPRIVPLPIGLSEVIIFIVSDSQQLTEFARIPLKVLTKAGFEKSTITPALDVTLKTQLVDDRTDDAGVPVRVTPYLGVTFNGSLAAEQQVGNTVVKSRASVLGASFSEDALRFGEKGVAAPQIDLTEYQIEVKHGNASVSLGNNDYGSSHSMLSSANNRGVKLKYNRSRFDLTLSRMNGQGVVGWDNFSGLEVTDNNISTASVGMEIIEDQPGQLRIEAMYLDGSLQPASNFNQGQIVDAEKSEGFSLHLKAQNLFERVHFDAQFARSTFNNGADAELSLGTGGLTTLEVTENARNMEMTLDLIKDWEVIKGKSFSFSITGHHERVDPQYRSIAAFTSADQITNFFSINTNFAGSNIFYKFTESEDNVDEIAQILKTETQSHAINVSLPVQSMFSDAATPNKWLPNLNYSFFRNRQDGVPNAALTTGGFAGTHLPEQVTISHTVEASWAGDSWDMSFLFSQTSQDNQQTGRQNADSKQISSELSLGYRPTDALSFNTGISRVEQDDKEIFLLRYTNNVNLGFNYSFLEIWRLSGNYSFTEERNSQVLDSSLGFSTNTQVSRQMSFELPGWGSLPGRAFMSHSLQSNVFKDNQFDSMSYTRNWTLNAGLSFTLF